MTAARIRLVARVGPAGSALSPYVACSVAAHVLFVAALVLFPSLRPKTPIADNPLVVDLVSIPRPANRVAPTPPAPQPEPTPSKGVHLEEREPPKPKPLPKKPPDKPRAEPVPTAPPSPPASPAPGEAGPGPSEVSGVTALEGGDVEFAWYRSSVAAALYSQWRRPILDGVRQPLEVIVAFEILRDGSVAELRVETGSGVPTLDRSALRAVTDASPLPPLPQSWRSSRLETRILFRLHPES